MNVIKIVIILALLSVSVWVGIWLKDSISAPIEFKEERKDREAEVRHKLETIAHLQKMYKQLNSRYAPTFDSLKHVLTTDTFYIEVTFGDIYDTTTVVSVDTIMLPAVDSLERYLSSNVANFTSVDDYFATIQDVPNSENYPGYQAGTRDIEEPVIVKWTKIDTFDKDTVLIEIRTGISVVDLGKKTLSGMGYRRYEIIDRINTIHIASAEKAQLSKLSIFNENYDETREEQIKSTEGAQSPVKTTKIDLGSQKILDAIKTLDKGSRVNRMLVSDFETGELNREIWVQEPNGEIWCRVGGLDTGSQLMRLYADDASGNKMFLFLDDEGKVWKGEPDASDTERKSDNRYWIHPVGTKEFEMSSSMAIVEGTDSMIEPSFQVQTFVGFYMGKYDDRYALYDSDYSPMNRRKIGNINKPNNTSGNW